MSEPTGALQALRASTADLLQGLEESGWADDDLAAASLCAGWTRGHVLTHLARNADGIAGTLAGALRGEVVARYPDGWDGRNAAIDEGAARPFGVIATDVRQSAERLDRVLGAVRDAGAWDAPTDDGSSARDWAPRRLREVEIHRVDLDGGYSPRRWPPLLVADLLPRAAETLADRAAVAVRVTVIADGSLVAEHVGRTWTAGAGDAVEVSGPDWAVLAWLVGRGRAAGDAITATPELGPWR